MHISAMVELLLKITVEFNKRIQLIMAGMFAPEHFECARKILAASMSEDIQRRVKTAEKLRMNGLYPAVSIVGRASHSITLYLSRTFTRDAKKERQREGISERPRIRSRRKSGRVHAPCCRAVVAPVDDEVQRLAAFIDLKEESTADPDCERIPLSLPRIEVQRHCPRYVIPAMTFNDMSSVDLETRISRNMATSREGH